MLDQIRRRHAVDEHVQHGLHKKSCENWKHSRGVEWKWEANKPDPNSPARVSQIPNLKLEIVLIAN